MKKLTMEDALRIGMKYYGIEEQSVSFDTSDPDIICGKVGEESFFISRQKSFYVCGFRAHRGLLHIDYETHEVTWHQM